VSTLVAQIDDSGSGPRFYDPYLVQVSAKLAENGDVCF